MFPLSCQAQCLSQVLKYQLFSRLSCFAELLMAQKCEQNGNKQIFFAGHLGFPIEFE